MKMAIVSSKDLGTDCWSAARFTGHCHLCARVDHCKLQEAHDGRLILAREAECRAKEALKLAVARRKRVEKEKDGHG